MTDSQSPRLTLMAVHAHPDDESTSTGGILARYALEGVRTVVVTCTNGELGDGPDGAKPGEDGHDPQQLAEVRVAELETACQRLGVTDAELLGYHDSGMLDWDYKDREDVFCNVPVEVVSAQVAKLVELYQPQVVVSYDPDGTYQHPDHVHAARAAALAVETTHVAAKLYAKAHGTSYWNRFNEALAEVGVHRPARSAEQSQTLESVEQRITTSIDVHHVVARKRQALLAHRTQLNSSLAARLPANLFANVFSTEDFFRADKAIGTSVLEDDLFAGLRSE